MNKRKQQQEFIQHYFSKQNNMGSSSTTFSVTKSSAGFTLIETLVAISILLIAIVGPLTLATRGLSAALVARDQITAFYLAQEAIEFVRVKRDEVVLSLSGAAWDSGFVGCMTGNGCTIEVTNGLIGTCLAGGCDPLLYNQKSGFYTYIASPPDTEESKFTRTIAIVTSPTNSDEIEVMVTMKWRTGPSEREFTLRDNLFNTFSL